MAPLRTGNNTPNNLYVGNQAVQRMYRGSEQVWPNPVSGTTQLTHNGATFTVSGVDSHGTFVDGTPWAVVSGSPQITEVAPVSAQLSRAHDPGNNVGASPTIAWGNGLVRNPGAAPSGTTLAERQAVNNGNSANHHQGWDELRVASYTTPYDAAKNIDPGATSSPVSATPGVYVKGISRTATTINFEGGGAVGAFGILTIAASAPPANAFRPAAALGAASPAITTADVDLTRLANQPTPSVSSAHLPTAEQALAQLSAGGGIEQDNVSVRAENILDMPSRDPNFLGDFAFRSYRGTTNKMLANMILLLQFDHWNASEKADITYALIQYAIDIAGKAEAGGIWIDDGGWNSRKFIVAFAARLTGHALFTDALGYTTTEQTFEDDPSPTVSIWGDDKQFFTITQTEIDYSVAIGAPAYSSNMMGWPEFGRQPIYASPLQSDQFRNDLFAGSTTGNYRNIIAAVGIPAALALRMMGAQSLYNNQIWFDYQDRHMSVRIANGGHLATGATDHDLNDISRLTLAAWQQERVALGGVWYSTAIVAAILGQSQPAFVFEPAFGAFTNPEVPSSPNLQVLTQPDNGTITSTSVTAANLASNAVNPTMGAWSAFFDHVVPGRQFVVADMAQQGTGRHELFADADADRDFADLSAMVDRLEADHAAPDVIVESWMVNDNSIAKTLPENYAPALMGQRWGGAAFTLSSTNPDATNYSAALIDHCLWDVEAAPDAKGRGLFTRAKTKWSIVGWPSQNSNLGTEVANFTTGTVQNQVDAPARARLSDLFEDTRVQTFAGYDGFSSHIALMTDAETLDGSEVSNVHPSIVDPDGLILMGWPYALAILRAAGVSVTEPRILGVKSDSPTDGSYMDIEVDLPNGGTLTTLRALRETASPTTPSPHQQDVVGFEIQRSGGDRRPVFLTTATAEPAAHRGTVAIIDDGASTGTGIIRVTPTTAFGFGDSVEFLRGDAGALLLNNRDTVNRIYLDMPIEHVPSLYDATATYPMEGIPVRPQPATLASVVPALAFTARSANFDGTNDYLNKSLAAPASGNGLLSFWFKSNEASWNAANLKNLFEFRITGGVARLYAYPTSSGRLDLYLADTEGANVNNDLIGGFDVGQWFHVLMGWTEGGTRCVYVNGVQAVAPRAMATPLIKSLGLSAGGVGGQATGARKWNGDIAHFYLNLDETLDITVQANREKFALSGSPVNLGADGSLPTGTAPRFYFDGDAPAWGNQGTEGSFTTNSPLTAGPAPSY